MSRSHSSRPTRKCSGCSSVATIYQDQTHYCPAHYRLRQMRHSAQRHGKVVPSRESLEGLAAQLHTDGMRCPACRRAMNWLFWDGRSTVVTLQHDRDGTIRLICKGCNSRHHLHPGDTFYQLPAGHKRCPACEAVKPLAEFYALRNGKTKSLCRDCEKAKSLSYYYRNKKTCAARNMAWKAAHVTACKKQRQKYQQANRARLSQQERLRRERRKA